MFIIFELVRWSSFEPSWVVVTYHQDQSCQEPRGINKQSLKYFELGYGGQGEASMETFTSRISVNIG